MPLPVTVPAVPIRVNARKNVVRVREAANSRHFRIVIETTPTAVFTVNGPANFTIHKRKLLYLHSFPYDRVTMVISVSVQSSDGGLSQQEISCIKVGLFLR